MSSHYHIRHHSNPPTPARVTMAPPPPHRPTHADQSADNPVNFAGNSTSWQSNRQNTVQKMTRVHNMAAHLGISSSPFFPHSVAEHVAHTAAYKDDCSKAEVVKMEKHLEGTKAVGRALKFLHLQGLEGEIKEREKTRLRVGKLMGGKDFEYLGVTTLLAKKSIWVAGVADDDVTWPSREEMKSEGDMQARQRFARRLPLPKLNKLKEIDRSEMMNSGEKGQKDVEEMEAGEMSMPFRMKEIAPVEDFDDTRFGQEDRFVKRLTEILPNILHSEEEIDEREIMELGCWGELLDDF